MEKNRIDYIADGLEAFKAKNHFSNRDLGHALGVSDNTISRIIHGDAAIRLSLETLFTIERIAMEGLKDDTNPQ